MGSFSANPLVLSASKLHVQIAGQVLIDNQDLLIHEGERVGLVGRNGCGKSTLMKILAGQEHFFAGEVSCKKNIRAAYMPQEVDLTPGKTVRDCILDGAADILTVLHDYEHSAPGKHLHELEAIINARDGWNLESRLTMLIDALAAPAPDRVVDTLSGGEKRRVGLCRVLLDMPDLLLLDEPTNHLDAETIEWMEDYFQRSSCTCLFVTHDRYFLDKVSTRILELSGGGLYSHDGNYQDFLRKKAEREADAEANDQRRLAFIRREIDWIRRGPQARSTKSWSRIQRFNNAANQEGIAAERDIALLIPPAPPMGNIVVSLKDVSLTLGERQLFAHLNLDFEPGMRLGIVGRNGLGKTSLLRLILGELQPSTGTVRSGERTQFNYIAQHRITLHDDKTVFEEIGEGNEFVLFNGRKINIWTYLHNFLFQDEEINTQVGKLSGGERNRLVLAQIIKKGGNFLLMDEPTNDLDLPTLRVLEEAINDFAGCVAVVSHDRYFLNRVCTHVLAFQDDGELFFQPGNFSYYAEKRAEKLQAILAAQAAQAAENKPASTATVAASDNAGDNAAARPRKLKWAEQRELDAMEAAIAAAEAAVAETEALFADPNFHARHGRQSVDITAKLDAQRAEVERLYARWAELEELSQGQ
ncbi:ABC-F family ATP-binding cassette domain-containing protein [Oligosphaera ethanolica]|uniref:ATP-binding cassette subfamily F protein uup n=1 Tax=Oligosphaera ethanolica TaxID=760260 RepID=A0AAE3VJI3_9BACT|nr:ABC-F family ATP-binding cassette domain-containing protein [Oligosphaera ethanolica]MDQ0291471.1 ATP-binding cassette subfamily F protein uup [Oligosphaera ethanolica]